MADNHQLSLDVRGGGTPSDGIRPRSRALEAVAAAWRGAGMPSRLAACLVALLAGVATLREGVPLLSGLAVALLVPAALVDHHERRLPDRLVGAAAAVLVGGVPVAALLGAELHLGGAVAGSVAFAGPLLVLHLISPAAMGFGDVKCALVLGFALGLVHWQLALAGLALATGLTAAAGLLARLETVAFGPGLVAAAAIALASAPSFAPTTAHGPVESAAHHHSLPLATDHPLGAPR